VDVAQPALPLDRGTPVSGPPVTADDVKRALYRHFTGRYAVLTEITTHDLAAIAEWEAKTGAELTRWKRSTLSGVRRRIDVLLVNHDERVAVEVKVTRPDLVADCQDPGKQAAWRAITHRHAYAVPEALLDTALIHVPPESGVLAVGDCGVRWARKCRRDPTRPVGDFTPDVLLAMFNRFADIDARHKGWSHSEHTPFRVDGEDALRAECERLKRELVKERDAHQRATDRANEWRRKAARQDPPPCHYCRGPLVPDWSREGKRNGGWKHPDPIVEQACRDKRVAQWGFNTYPHPAEVA
jgi:hypothetical protein